MRKLSKFCLAILALALFLRMGWPTLAEFKKLFRAEVKKKPKEIVLFVLRGKQDTQLLRIEPRW